MKVTIDGKFMCGKSELEKEGGGGKKKYNLQERKWNRQEWKLRKREKYMHHEKRNERGRNK